MSPIKEPHFFAADVFGDHPDFRVRTLGEYLECFVEAGDEKRIGECSVAYLSSPSAPHQIKTFAPAGRIIIMLRNPVEMMYALHSQLVYATTENILDFGAALDADEKKELGLALWQGRRKPWPSYRQMASYTQQVRRYFEVFGRERVHVIIYDDFAHDTKSAYQKTLEFLDVKSGFEPEFRVVNSNHRVRSMRLQRFLLRQSRALTRIIPRRPRRFVGQLLLGLNTKLKPRPAMDPVLRRRLLREFESEVKQLGNLLGRDLSSWCKTDRTNISPPSPPSLCLAKASE